MNGERLSFQGNPSNSETNIKHKLKSIMNETLTKLNELFEAFKTDATAQAEKGNKAAGARARKASNEIAKELKKFRAISLGKEVKE